MSDEGPTTPKQPPTPTMQSIVKALRSVFDPEIPVNIHDLGLIYSVDIAGDGIVRINMTLTSPNCPVAEALPEQVRQSVLQVPGVTDASINLVWDPPWDASRMSEAARLELEFTGHTGPAHLRKSVTQLTVGRRRRDQDRR